MSEWILAFGVLLASWLGCGLLRPVLRRLKIVDRPDQRRLHDHIVVRGGGLMMVLLMLLFVLLRPLPGVADGWLLLALAVVAMTGMLDDVITLPAWFKLPLLAVGAVLLLQAVGITATADNAVEWLPLWLQGRDWVTLPLLLLAVLWTINVFNFMDGSHGLTASQVIIGCAGLLLFADGSVMSVQGLNGLAWMLLLVTLGFLPWNFPRARMFLGDVGSLSLGLLMTALLLLSLQHDAISLPQALLLPAVFLVDATATLLLRLWQRRKWYQAHTDHAYQQLVLHGWSHAQVWLLYLALNLLLVWPGLWAQRQWPQWQWQFGMLVLAMLLLGWCLVQCCCNQTLAAMRTATLPVNRAGGDRHD